MSSNQHLSAVLPFKNSHLVVDYRPTATPGPNELLIEVKAVAINPADYYQRDLDFLPNDSYPTVLGSDVGGVVLEAGSSVPKDAPKPGTRVAALASAYFNENLNSGAFQTRVLVPATQVTPVPKDVSFNEASVLSVAVITAWTGLHNIGIPRETAYTPSGKQGILVWGGASSVGSAVVQIARSMGFVVYATASRKHHEYIQSLGAKRTFDYHDEDVIGQIKTAAQEEGLLLEIAYDAVGKFQLCFNVLKELKSSSRTARIVSATPIPADFTPIPGVEAKFVTIPQAKDERDEHFHFVFGVWLKEKLAKKEYVPSPHIQVIEGGLESANRALDLIKEGVSGTKLVLEI